MDLNQFFIIGRLTRDVEIKYSQSGVPVGRLSIANNQKVKRNGQWQDVSNFFDIAIFGKSANNLAQYLTKGKQIAVSGAMKQDRWTDTNGNNHTKISLIASQLQLLGGANGTQNQNQNRNSYSQGNGAAYQQQQQSDTLNSLQQAGLVDDEPPLWEEVVF